MALFDLACIKKEYDRPVSGKPEHWRPHHISKI